MYLPFTQTKEYLSWHQAVGTKTFYREFYFAVVASVVLDLRIGRILYVPYGPFFLKNISQEQKNEIIKYLRDLAKKENCVFVRLEDFTQKKKDTVLWGDEQNIYPDGQNLFSFFVKSNMFYPPKKAFAKEGIFQPRVEWWLDLQKNEEEILNNFHKDHRYSIRRALKENVQIEIVKPDENNFKIFWELMRVTSERDGFSLYEEDYYRQIFSPGEAGGLEKFLVFTKIEDKYLSVALVVISDKVANLVFAGSVSEKRELGFNHLMQWEAIKESKRLGCDFYNFGGIYENGYGKETLQGVTNFKKRFGGFAKFHGDFLDIPIKPFKYMLYLLYKIF